jgi:hypothetical protein
MMAFSIHTSAKEAASVVEAQEAILEASAAQNHGEASPKIEDGNGAAYQHHQLHEEDDAFDMFVGSNNNGA